jgi:hypothetical protein
LGELVSETLLNTHVRDNLLFLKSSSIVAEATSTTNTDSGVNGTATAITLPNIAIPADVGAVYCEAWAWMLNTGAHQNASNNSAYAGISETTAGKLVESSVYVGGAGPAIGAPFYARTRHQAWAGTTRTVSLYVTGANCQGSLQASYPTPSDSPIVLRIVRAY